MPFDDELRDRLRRERDRLPATTDPSHLLTALRPEMRRARRLRRMTHVGVGALLLLAGIGVAQVGAGDDDGSLQIVPTGDGEPIALPRSTVVSPADVTTTTPSTPLPPGSSVDEDQPDDPVDTVAPPRATPAHDVPPSSSAVVIVAVPEPPDGSLAGTDTPPEPDGGDATTDEPDTTAVAVPTPEPSTTVEVDDAPEQPPTTTNAPATSPTRFDTACGYVLADVSGDAVTIVEIVPAPGYHAKVEDPDHGSIEVHFEGTGEDCEIKIS